MKDFTGKKLKHQLVSKSLYHHFLLSMTLRNKNKLYIIIIIYNWQTYTGVSQKGISQNKKVTETFMAYVLK